MSENHSIIELGQGDHAERHFTYEPDAETLRRIISQIDSDPLQLPSPLGDIEILENKQEALEELLSKRKLSASLTAAFHHSGGDTVIAHASPLTGTTAISLAAFGYGVHISISAELVTRKKTMQHLPDKSRRPQYHFIVRWMLEHRIEPGFVQRNLVAETVQVVNGPAHPAHEAPPSTQPHKGGGWFGS